MTTLCIAGKNQVAIDVLDCAFGSGRYRVHALPNAGDNCANEWQPSFRAAANARGIPIVDLDWARAQAELCFLSLEYDRLIKPESFASDRLFNIHFSLLPKYRGCHTAIWPILNGESVSGVTLHWIDTGMDTGQIVDQRAFSIECMTSRELYFRCMVEGAALVCDWLDRLVDGKVPGFPQDNRKASTYRRRDLDFGLKEIDPSQSVETCLRRIRAFNFREYQLPTFRGSRVIDAERATRTASVGSVERLQQNHLIVNVSDGALLLTLESA